MSLKLDYWRADNMWAAFGHPDGNLGMETVTLEAGQKRTFVTDWKHEKQRNDGTTFYGSHARRLKNSGTEPIHVSLTTWEGIGGTFMANILKGFLMLKPGETVDVKGDIKEVSAKGIIPLGG